MIFKLNYIFIVVAIFVVVSSVKASDIKTITQGQNTPTINEEARLLYNKGTNALNNNDYVNAEALLLKAVEIDQGFADAFDHLGVVYRKLNDLSKAIEMYKKSIAIFPDNKVAYGNMGLIYRQLSKNKEAFYSYIKVIEIDDSDPEGYFGAGSILQDLEQYEESEKFISSAIYYYNMNKSPYIYDALYLQSYNHYHLKDCKTLSQYIEGLIIKFPNDNNLLVFNEECK